MIRMPEELWKEFRDVVLRTKGVAGEGIEHAVEVRLADGTVVRNILIDREGRILGRIVGGQTGVDEDVGFSQDDIKAARIQDWWYRLKTRSGWVGRTG